jgi:DNA-binding XRE family transcriptional regulator
LSVSIKTLREQAGRTRQQVAADLDISERHLYRLENQGLERRWVLVFAAYYGVPPEAIENGGGAA